MRSHTGVSPSGKATDSDSVIRRFESYYPCHYDPLAQLAEHLTFNQGVPSSNLGWITTFHICGPLVKRSKTSPFHGENMGSNPVGVTTWAISSAGRAPALQAGCQQFDPVIAHQTLFKELEHEGLHHRARFLFIFTRSACTNIHILYYRPLSCYGTERP